MAGTEAGISVSDDNGNTWSERYANLDGDAVTEFAEKKNGYLFAVFRYGRGILRSTDRGNSWTLIDSTFWGVTSIAVSARGQVFVGVEFSGVYRTADDGLSWLQVNNGLMDLVVESIATNGSDTVYCGTRTALFRPTDSGANWLRIVLCEQQFYGIIGRAFSVGPAGDVLFAGDSLVRSTDGGDTWRSAGVNGVFMPVIARNSTGHIFVGHSEGLYRSTNDGKTWAPIDQGLTSRRVNAICFNSSGYIFVGGAWRIGNGVFRSTNNGDTWTRLVEGYCGTSVYEFASLRSGSVLALSDGGSFRTTDKGSSWLRTTDSSFGFLVSDNQGRVWTAFAGGVSFSTDEGTSWSAPTGPANAMCLSFSKSGDILVGSWDGQVARSTDGGTSWSASRVVPASQQYTWPVFSLSVNSQEYIFALTHGQGIYRSTDGGKNWTQQNTGLSDLYAYSIVINELGDIFVGTEYGMNGGGVYLSNDNGQSWKLISSITTVYTLALNGAGHIFAGTIGSGVLRSTDNGISWARINEGLTNSKVMSLCIDQEGYVFAGSLGSGVFRTSQSIAHVEMPSAISLAQNYPNPFNPGTTIQYDLPTAAFTTLKIYNLLGQDIATLVNEVKDAGTHSVRWTAAAMPSGVYLYRLQTGNFVETRKLLLIK